MTRKINFFYVNIWPFLKTDFPILHKTFYLFIFIQFQAGKVITLNFFMLRALAHFIYFLNINKNWMGRKFNVMPINLLFAIYFNEEKRKKDIITFLHWHRSKRFMKNVYLFSDIYEKTIFLFTLLASLLNKYDGFLSAVFIAAKSSKFKHRPTIHYVKR